MISIQNNSKFNKHFIGCSFLAAFVCMFIFFYFAHPIVILDADDWQYVSYSRLPIPYTGYWNPSRILPEILMNICGSTALLVYRAGLLGYIESQILIFAIVVSLFIAFYVTELIKFLKEKFCMAPWTACVCGAVFLAMHFIVFRKTAENNLYMFYSYDMCCYFYYTISALLNCTLVMYFWRTGVLNDFFSKNDIVQKIFIAIAIYFSVFSNLFNSIILVAYLGIYFLYSLICSLKKKTVFSAFLKKQLAPILIILLWLLAVYCDGNGGRAGNGWDSRNFLSDLLLDFNYLFLILKSFSYAFYTILALVILGFILVIATHSDSKDNQREFLSFIIYNIASAFIIILFLVLLCARVNTGYFLRPQVMFGFIFSMFVILIGCIAYIVSYWKPAKYLLLPALLVMLILCNTKGVTYAYSNPMNLPEKVCISVDNDLIDQMVNADKSGTEKTYIYVMDTGVDDNWPHTAFIGYALKQTLLKHGIIQRNFGIIPEMSTEFNERNGIEVEFFWPRQFRAFYPTLF